MNLLRTAIDFVLHVDRHLDSLIQQFGPWIYVLLFLVIFCETGLVVTPFLPGDSLLFALGAFAARGSLDFKLLLLIIPVAAFLGDNTNYWIGKSLAPRLVRGERLRFLNEQHLERTHAFFEKYGAKTIVFARFVPIVRTFTPFVAGLGKMTFRRFLLFSVIATGAWVGVFLPMGYFFANHPLVKKNFTAVIFAIIALSVMPGVIEFLRVRYLEKKKENT